MTMNNDSLAANSDSVYRPGYIEHVFDSSKSDVSDGVNNNPSTDCPGTSNFPKASGSKNWSPNDYFVVANALGEQFNESLTRTYRTYDGVDEHRFRSTFVGVTVLLVKAFAARIGDLSAVELRALQNVLWAPCREWGLLNPVNFARLKDSFSTLLDNQVLEDWEPVDVDAPLTWPAPVVVWSVPGKGLALHMLNPTLDLDWCDLAPDLAASLFMWADRALPDAAECVFGTSETDEGPVSFMFFRDVLDVAA